MTAEKALSKMGHRWTPKGLSMLGNGMDLKISWEDDILRVGMRTLCVCEGSETVDATAIAIETTDSVWGVRRVKVADT